MATLALTGRDRKKVITDFYSNVRIGGDIATRSDVTRLTFKAFCRYLKFSPTPDQEKLVHYTLSRRITNVPAAHGVGKSAIASVLVLYATIVKRALVISSAPTRRQVESIIWRNVNAYYQVLKANKRFQKKFGIDLKHDYAIGQTFLRQLDTEQSSATDQRLWFEQLVFEEIDEQLYESNNDSSELGYAFGFTSRSDTSSFQGLHAPRLLMILDEATGVADVIHEAALSCVTGSGNHLLRIGNPTERGVAFHQSCVRDGCYPISAFSHPNVSPFYEKQDDGRYEMIDDTCLKTDYVDPIPGAISPKWIEEALSKYGENSLFVRTRIYAKFPLLGQGTSTIIAPSLIAKSTEDYQYDDSVLIQFSTNHLLVGLDVGETEDPSVLTISQWIKDNDRRDIKKGYLCVRGIYERDFSGINDGLEQKRIYDWAHEIIEGFRSGSYLGQSSVFLQIDATGVGSGLSKDFILNTKYVVTPIHFASSAIDSKSYINIRAEMYFDLARLYEKAKMRFFQSVDEAEVEELHYQLSGTSYEIDPKNDRKKLVAKDLIKQIIGRSPDHADATVLSARGIVMAEIEV